VASAWHRTGISLIESSPAERRKAFEMNSLSKSYSYTLKNLFPVLDKSQRRYYIVLACEIDKELLT
jgi:hypothetical protein